MPDLITYTCTDGLLAGMTLTNGTVETHPTAGRGVKFSRHGNPAMTRKTKGQDAFIRCEGRPDLARLADEFEAARAAQRAESDRIAAAGKAADAALIAAMRTEESRLVALIPSDHVRIEEIQTGWFDGERTYRLMVGGYEIWIGNPAIVRHGAAHATRPGALNSFAAVSVWSVPASEVERLAAAAAEKQATANAQASAASEERAAKLATAAATGQRVELRRWIEGCCERDFECSTDIVTEYAMPDGTVGRSRVHTH